MTATRVILPVHLTVNAVFVISLYLDSSRLEMVRSCWNWKHYSRGHGDWLRFRQDDLLLEVVPLCWESLQWKFRHHRHHLEEIGELSIVNSGLIDQVDILKVAHHGSKTSSSELFLSQLRPEIALISVGQNNQFNHPSPEVLANLHNVFSRVIRTDQSGDISIILLNDKFYIASPKNNSWQWSFQLILITDKKWLLLTT